VLPGVKPRRLHHSTSQQHLSGRVPWAFVRRLRGDFERSAEVGRPPERGHPFGFFPDLSGISNALYELPKAPQDHGVRNQARPSRKRVRAPASSEVLPVGVRGLPSIRAQTEALRFSDGGPSVRSFVALSIVPR
jgi:hypothetical protein